MPKILFWKYDHSYTFLYIKFCNLRTLTDELAHYIQQLFKAELIADKLYCEYIGSEIVDLESTTPLQAPTLLLRLHTALF